MIQCNKCYADNRDDALYCRRCGKKFPDLADQILQRIIGQDKAVKVIRELAEYYLMLKRNSSHGQRPDMDILLKGSSGTGKDFIANIIQEYFFKKGIVQKQMVMVDAADFEAWMETIISRLSTCSLAVWRPGRQIRRQDGTPIL